MYKESERVLGVHAKQRGECMSDIQVLEWKEMLDRLYMEDNPEKKMQEAISAIASELGIHMILLSIDKVRGKHCELTLYSNGSYQNLEKKQEYHYCREDGADSYLFSLYAKQNVQFREKERQICELLTKMLYIILDVSQARKVALDCETTDWQTGIGNLNLFYRRGQAIIDEGKINQYAAVYLNIKNFKLINEMFGGEVGNNAIINYAQSLDATMWENEILVHLGGDNFVALLFHSHLEEFLERVKDYPVYVTQNEKKLECRLSARAGVYLPDKSVERVEQIMNCISSAAACAKYGSGDKEVVYHTEVMHEKLRQESKMEKDLDPALRDGELVAYFQPKVNLEKKEIVGAEALVRWRHEDRILCPDEFIPVAERNGFVCQIDYEILKQTCRHIQQWKKEGIQVVPVSVNFSKRHLVNKNTADLIYETVKKYEVEPELIEIEFTETAFYNDQKEFQEIVEKLKKYGFRTSVDDFGAGSSNLNLLQNLVFDVLKIDKSFLDDAEHMERNRVILENLVHMAKELSMGVICEGVETQEHADFLKSIKCQYVQGFLFDRPLTAEAFREKLIMRNYT